MEVQTAASARECVGHRRPPRGETGFWSRPRRHFRCMTGSFVLQGRKVQSGATCVSRLACGTRTSGRRAGTQSTSIPARWRFGGSGGDERRRRRRRRRPRAQTCEHHAHRARDGSVLPSDKRRLCAPGSCSGFHLFLRSRAVDMDIQSLGTQLWE